MIQPQSTCQHPKSNEQASHHHRPQDWGYASISKPFLLNYLGLEDQFLSHLQRIIQPKTILLSGKDAFFVHQSKFQI